MFELIRGASNRPIRVLCIGAHCDDVEIGCGGTLLTLQAERPDTVIDWAVLSGSEQRHEETRSSMHRLAGTENRGDLVLGAFPDGRFPAYYEAVKEFVESLKRLPAPDVIFCHERGDLHQDHRLVNEMVWNTFRNHLVLEFEVPKWDGGLTQPNVYVPVTESHAAEKVAALLEAYATQRNRDWFRADTFMALLRLRGIECRSPSGLAEAFHGHKLRLGGFDA